MNGRNRRRVLGLVTVACIGLLTPPSAVAGESVQIRSEPSRGYKVYDAAVLRPLAFGNLVAATAIFPLAYPVTLATGGREHVVRYCWDVPAERLFHRPLGEL